ncbi:MAG: peptide chain release factor N(5)-glutamine methyltransferase [Alphaproteobacteria bacterium]|nr:peptide chain release factor N(5)-glutamine methyltransferase [Alphaproteobacteria bacterium]
MNTLQEIYGDIIQKLDSSGIESSALEARRLIKRHFGIDWTEIVSNPGKILPASTSLETDLQRRLDGEPLSRIEGVKEFRGLEFALGPDTLDPRPETEILVDWALELFHGKHPGRILDLGTGTGCIPICLLTEWKDTRGLATDIAPGALDIARRNAETHKVADRLEFLQADWGQGIDGPFDLIVSNPPYIPESDIGILQKEVRNHDPILALSGGFDGLEAYEKIFSSLPRLLKPAGKALFEIGAGQEADIERLAGKYRIRIEGVRPDYAGITRVVEISNGDN